MQWRNSLQAAALPSRQHGWLRACRGVCLSGACWCHGASAERFRGGTCMAFMHVKTCTRQWNGASKYVHIHRAGHYVMSVGPHCGISFLRGYIMN